MQIVDIEKCKIVSYKLALTCSRAISFLNNKDSFEDEDIIKKFTHSFFQYLSDDDGVDYSLKVEGLKIECDFLEIIGYKLSILNSQRDNIKYSYQICEIERKISERKASGYNDYNEWYNISKDISDEDHKVVKLYNTLNIYKDDIISADSLIKRASRRSSKMLDIFNDLKVEEKNEGISTSPKNLNKIKLK